MTKQLIASAAAILIFTGCESTPDQKPRYQPTDGRNLSPGMRDASHGDPQFPGDIDRGGGGGTR